MTTPPPEAARCPREGRWFGGCKFEARYDRKVTGMNSIGDHLFVSFSGENRNDNIYVRDVCVRCGRTIEREHQPRPAVAP